MAVICCATPSELYLEETRSTLLFASRAKLVKTNAQVNEVLDDRSLIRRLQRELAEARRHGLDPGQQEQLRALESKAMTAGTAARDAEQRLDRLKSSIHTHAAIFSSSTGPGNNLLRIPNWGTGSVDDGAGTVSKAVTRKRRLSDGNLATGLSQLTTPPRRTGRMTTTASNTPQRVPHVHKRAKRAELSCSLSPSSELEIVREAYNTKLAHVKRLEDALHESEGKLAAKESSLVDARKTITDLETGKDEAVQEAQQLSSEISSLFTEMQAAALRHENAIAEKNATLCAAEDKLRTEEASKKSLQELVDKLTRDNEDLKDSVRAAEERIMTELSKAAAEKLQLDDAIRDSSNERSALTNKVKELESQLVASEQTIVGIQNEKQELESRFDTLSKERDELQGESSQAISEKESAIKQKEEALKVLEAEVLELKQLLASANDSVSVAREAALTAENELKEKDGKLEEARKERVQLDDAIRDLESQLAASEQTIVGIQNEKQELESRFDTLSEERDQLQGESSQAISEKESAIKQKEEVLKVLEAEVLELKQLLASANDSASVAREAALTAENELKEKDEKLEEARKEKMQLDDAIHDLESQLAASEQTIVGIQNEKQELEIRLNTLSEERDQLQGESSQTISEKESAIKQKEEALKVLEAEVLELKQLLASANDSVSVAREAALTAENELKEKDEKLEEARKEKMQLDDAIHDLESQLAVSEQTIVGIQNEKQELEIRLNTLSEERDQLQGESSQTISEKESAIKQKEEALKVLEAEVLELKQLLASANDSVSVAREAALTAEDELKEKDEKLQETLDRLLQSEEEVRFISERLSQLDSEARSCNSVAHNQLMDQIDLLTTQKLALESTLEKERIERMSVEEDLKRLMAEEQRTLMHEAEKTVISLKNQIRDLTSSLSNAEAEAYAAGQEIEDLRDECKRLETKALEADVLRQNEKRLKDQVSGLSEAKLGLQAELARTKQMLGFHVDDSEQELVKTIAELNRVKGECYAAKNEVINTKEELQRLRQENTSSARDVRLLQEKALKLEGDISNLEEENQKLSSRLRKLERAEIQQMDNARRMEKANARVKELEDLIQSKDHRIKKLETVKLTKEKCAAIERMKVR